MAVFQVTTQDDAVNANDGVLSLREAVAQAASNAGSDTITFSSSVFTPGNGTIELTQGQLQITQAGGAVIILGDIDGNGAADVTIDAGGDSRVLNITGASPARQANVTLDHLVITGGGTSEATDTLSGAGVNARLANLTITGSTITGNHASANYSSLGTVGGGGIAVFNSTVSIENSSVSGNTGSDYNVRGGGILAAESTVTITGSEVSGNSAGYGGGISGYHSSITVTGTTVGGNRASGEGGGGEGGGLDVVGGEITIAESSIAENSTFTSLGGRWWAGTGGGIAAVSGAIVTISATSISGNRGTDGGGIFGAGGADITVVGSTISDNVAAHAGSGGGVLFSGGNLTLTNTTVSGNGAFANYGYYGGGNGGGIRASGNVLITNSTIVGNTARLLYGDTYTGVGYGGGLQADGNVTVRNTIIAGNIADHEQDISGSIVSNGHNLFSQGGISGAAAGDIVVSSDGLFTWVLTPLADNGGSTLTYALLPWGPGVGGGLNSDATDGGGQPLAADQLGHPRIVSGTVDIGAFEFDSPVLSGTAGANSLSGGAASGALLGLGGNDTLFGNGGADSIGGGAGNDSIDSGTGNDVVVGGTGNDAVYLGFGADRFADLAAGFDSVYGGDGDDFILFGGGSKLGEGGAGNDTLFGGSGGDSLDGMDGNDRVSGGDGADLLRGGTGNDTELGGAGNDTITGGYGNDSLDGGTGGDRMTGGAGNDTFIVDSIADVTYENAGQGTDLIVSYVSRTLGANLENLNLVGDLAFNGTGNGLNNLIASDYLSFSANVLDGRGGADTLIGESGSDTLIGGAGNDVLVGGGQADSLIGGAGSDVFDYDYNFHASASNPDRIAGFDGVGNAAGDRIDLTDVYDGSLTFVTGAVVNAGQVHVVENGDGNSRVEANTGFFGTLVIIVEDGSTVASTWRAADFFL